MAHCLLNIQGMALKSTVVTQTLPYFQWIILDIKQDSDNFLKIMIWVIYRNTKQILVCPLLD